MDTAPDLEFIVHAGKGTGPDRMAQAIVTIGTQLGILPSNTRISYYPGRDGADAMEYLVAYSGATNVMSTCTPTFLTTPLKYHLALRCTALSPICQLVADSYLLVVPALSSWANAQDLIRTAQQRPGTICAGAAPKGGNNHIHAHLITQATGAIFNLRFFSTSHALLEALAAGTIDWTTAVAAELHDQKWRGKFRVIGALSEKRSPIYPAVPTLSEQNVPVTFTLWRGIVGPPSMPQEARSRLETALRVIAERVEWHCYLEQNGQQAAFHDGMTFACLLATEQQNYQSWLAALGVISTSNTT